MTRENSRFTDASDYRFHDEPVFYEIKQYEKTRDQYIERVSALPGVVAIYQMGGVSAPGISDLDLIVVLDDTFPPPNALGFSTRQMSSIDQYIFMHPGGMVMRREVFAQLNLLTYAANLTHRWGETLPTPDSASSVNVSYANLIDQSTHLLHALTKSALSSTIFVRRMIMSLSSIGHTLALAQAVGLSVSNEWEQWRKEVQSLKTNWFKKPDHVQLLSFADDGISIVLDIMQQVANQMVDEQLLPAPEGLQPARTFYHGINAFTVFAPPDFSADAVSCWGVPGFSLKIGQFYANTTLSVVTLPAAFASHVDQYAFGHTALSARIRANLDPAIVSETPGSICDSDYSTMLRNRVDLWGNNLSYLSKHGLMAFDVMPFFCARLAYGESSSINGAIKSLRDTAVMAFNRWVFYRAKAR